MDKGGGKDVGHVWTNVKEENKVMLRSKEQKEKGYWEVENTGHTHPYLGHAHSLFIQDKQMAGANGNLKIPIMSSNCDHNNTTKGSDN